jgi:hypothetical protein
MRQWNAVVLAMLFVGCSGTVTGGKGSTTHEKVGVSAMPIVGARAKAPPMRRSLNPGKVAITSTGNGIGYNGGPIMTGTVNLYYIWYGNWGGDSATTILSDWGNSVSSSPNYFINDTYDDSSGNHVDASVVLAGQTNDGYSRGQNITGGDIWTIVTSALSSGQLPVDGNGVYFVLTSGDVDLTDGFCTQFCGWHTAGSFNNTDIKFAFVGNPSRCNGSCGGLGTTPNGNAGADDMASIMFHELSETVTDPLINAWGDGNGENGDKCAWNFGSTYASGNGSPANAHLGNRDFLMQQMWANTGGGFCAQSLAAPQGASPPGGCGQMLGGQGLTVGQSLSSCDGRFALAMQYDGNLVLYQGGSALWATNSWGSTGYGAVMQNDGNFVLYDVNQGALFASNSWGQPGNTIALQDDGNLVVYNASGGPVWASNTCCR